MRSGSQKTVDPQSGQKWKVTGFPAAESRVNDFDEPWTTLIVPRSKKAAMLNTLPVRRWQSTQ
jgi:hypothetical protein